MLIRLRALHFSKAPLFSLSEEDIQAHGHHVTCPVCETDLPPEIFARIGRHYSKSQLEICQCKECEAIYYLNPPGESQVDFYYQNLWNKTKGESLDSEVRVPTKVRRKISQMLGDLKLPKDIRILEVGCGTGSMLAGLIEDGYTNIYGLEQSKFRSKVSEKRFPRRIFSEGYASHKPRKSYDLIFCNHVLEHLYRPCDYIKWVNENLSDDGVAIICVPNQEWEQVPNQLFLLPHLHSMSSLSLSKLAELSDLSVRFWMRSDRCDEICIVCFRGEGKPEWSNSPFAELRDYPSIALTSQKERFKSMWSATNEKRGSSVVVNWANANRTIANAVQRWNGYTVWHRFWRHVFSFLAFRQRLAIRYWYPLNRGQRLINRLISSLGREVTDYNYLEYQITGKSSDGVPEISFNENAVVFLK